MLKEKFGGELEVRGKSVLKSFGGLKVKEGLKRYVKRKIWWGARSKGEKCAKKLWGSLKVKEEREGMLKENFGGELEVRGKSVLKSFGGAKSKERAESKKAWGGGLKVKKSGARQGGFKPCF